MRQKMVEEFFESLFHQFPWKICLPAMFLLLVSGMVAPCFSSSATDPEQTIIKVGLYENSPKIFTDLDGKAAGFWPDLLSHMAEKENWTLVYVQGTWKECLERLKNQTIDILPDVVFTQERDQSYGFSKDPVLDSWSRVYVGRENLAIHSILDLKNQRIAVLRESVNFNGPDGIQELADQFNLNCTFLEYDNYDQAFAAVQSGAADAAVTNRNFGDKNREKFNLKRTAIVFQPIGIKFAFPKNILKTEVLPEKIDLHMGKFIQDEGSIYYQLLEKYFETQIAEKKVEKIPDWLLKGVQTMGILVVFLLVATLTSRIQVRKKTREIEIKAQALQASELHLRTLIATIPDLVWLKDPQGVYLSCNPKYEQLLGVPMTEILGKTDYDFYSPPMAVFFQERDKAAIAAGNPIRYEDDYIYAFDGHKEMLDTIKTPMYAPGGRLIGVLGIARDITHRKQAEASLVQSEAYHKKLFEASPIALFIQDFSQVIDQIQAFKKQGIQDLKTYLENNPDQVSRLIDCVTNVQVNQAAMDLYKASSHQDMCKFQLFSESDNQQQFVDQIVGFFQGKEQFECQSVIQDFQGNRLDVMVRKIVMTRQEKGPLRILASLVDLTRLHQAFREKGELEKQLRHAQKMETIGTLAGGIAHDFNNILVPIVGYTEMLLHDPSIENSLKSDLEKIHTASLRARELVKQILTFSRTEVGERKPIRIQPIVREVLSLIGYTIPKTIDIHQEIQEECGAILADPTQVHQILMNLVTNAYHAMAATGGVLKVRLAEQTVLKADQTLPGLTPGPYLCLTVTDTGSGMDQVVRERIFDPFFTTKEVGRGTGMGLSVVHGIVQGMNGNIFVRSEPGKGTEFKVCVPLAKTGEFQESQLPGMLVGGTERVLLVDDEPDVLEMENRLLTRLGYQVTSHPSGIEALETFRISPDRFDLVITDLNMPGMDGDTLSSELRKIRPSIPILICTGLNEKKIQSKDPSRDNFIIKPITLNDFAAMIRKILAH